MNKSYMLYDDIIVICYYIVNKKNIIGLINIIIKNITNNNVSFAFIFIMGIFYGTLTKFFFVEDKTFLQNLKS